MKEMSVEEKYKDIKSKLGSKTVSVDYRYLSADHQHRLDIMVDDVLFKSFLYKGNDVKQLNVFFSVHPSLERYPSFDRITWARFYDGLSLSITDMLYYTNASTFWLGDKNHDLPKYVLKLVKRIMEVHNIPVNAVNFIGDSKGATASVILGNLLPGSNVVAINPVYDLKTWIAAKKGFGTGKNRFQKATGIMIDDPANDKRLHIRDIATNKETKFFLFHSINDEFDLYQCKVLREYLNIESKDEYYKTYFLGNLTDNIILFSANIPYVKDTPHHIYLDEYMTDYSLKVLKRGLTENDYSVYRIIFFSLKKFYALKDSTIKESLLKFDEDEKEKTDDQKGTQLPAGQNTEKSNSDKAEQKKSEQK